LRRRSLSIRSSRVQHVDVVTIMRASGGVAHVPVRLQLKRIRDNTETTRTSVEAVKEHLVLAHLASLSCRCSRQRAQHGIAAAILTSIVGTSRHG
jgi:hypothetical protein